MFELIGATDSSDLVAKLAKYQGDIAPEVTGLSKLSDAPGGWLGSGGTAFERAYYLNDRIQPTQHAIEFIANNWPPARPQEPDLDFERVFCAQVYA